MKKNYIVGMDIGGTTAKIGLVREKDGKIVQKVEVQTILTLSWENLIDNYCKPVEKWFHDGYKIKALGIGVPGLFNQKTALLNNCENIPALSRAPFLEYIQNKFNIPVFADNDATCATIGEHYFGAGKNYTDFILVTIGTGLGGGLILNNKIYRGKSGYAGEIGHQIIVPEGRICSCGNRGCIEAYSSATAMINRVKYGLKKGYIKEGYDISKPITAKLIFKNAMEGEPYSLDIVNEAARYLGRILGGVINLLNLEAIIIGGGVAAAGDFFIDKIKFYSSQVAWYLLTQNLQFLCAELINDAGIIGSASLAMNELKHKKK